MFGRPIFLNKEQRALIQFVAEDRIEVRTSKVVVVRGIFAPAIFSLKTRLHSYHPRYYSLRSPTEINFIRYNTSSSQLDLLIQLAGANHHPHLECCYLRLLELRQFSDLPTASWTFDQ